MVVVVVVGGGGCGCCCCCCCCLSHLQVVALYRVGTLPATVLVLLIVLLIKDIKGVNSSHWQYNMRHASAKKLLLLLLLLLLVVVVVAAAVVAAIVVAVVVTVDSFTINPFISNWQNYSL